MFQCLIYFSIGRHFLKCFYVAYMQGEPNISPIYRFMLSVSYIEELDISSLVIHVYRGSFTSPLMHCILYFMWVRALSSLLHVMYLCRGANFTSLSSWMYIAYTFLLLICFILPLCWWLTKRGRKILSLYMHI